MTFKNKIAHITFSVFMTCLLTQATLGQQSGGQQDGTADDVLTINTELVQTGITVFDKQGRFVDGLKKEDFELRVDGKPQAVSFFERVVAGSQREAEQLAATQRGGVPNPARAASQSPARRTVIFFIDDLHLSLDSAGRTRQMLLEFIDKKMGQNDLVVIASASGQIGFLQQFTDNKEVLRAAVSRLNYSPLSARESGSLSYAPMTEYIALAIERRENPDILRFYVQECLKGAIVTRGIQRLTACEAEVVNRARRVLLHAAGVTSSMYNSLEMLLRSSARMPGSKLAFFVSDGFLLDTGPRNSSPAFQLERITDAARRAGVVIYTIDSRGLVSGMADATNQVPIDTNGRLEEVNLREIAAMQDAMNALAADTGGRALRNQNVFGGWVNKVIDETSNYYLLAWRPDYDVQKGEKFHKIEVHVVGRPELSVRAARGFFSNKKAVVARTESQQRTGVAAQPEKDADASLRAAVTDYYPRTALPTQLSLTYLDTPQSGSMLTTSVQIDTAALTYGADARQPARVSVAGVVLNEQGKPAASFKTSLSVNPNTTLEPSQQNTSNVIYNYPALLKPGIYQVRVAAREDATGLVGNAAQWIVIPDLSNRQLSLSSLIVGLQNVKNRSAEMEQIQWSVDKRFSHGSHLRFMLFVYNAERKGNALPDLAARVQVYSDGQEAVSTVSKKLAVGATTDLARIPFSGEINLGTLPAGRYVLRVEIEDRTAKKSVTKQTTFEIK